MDSLSPADVLWSALLLSGVIAQLLERRVRRLAVPAARAGAGDRAVGPGRKPTNVASRSLTHV